MAATPRSIRIALVAALGGFLLGFDATVISGAVPFIRDYFGLGGAAGSLALGWAVSSLGWGAMVGNLGTGVLSDRYGRRSVLLLTAVLFFASSLLAAAAHSFPTFILARILGGLAVGAAILVAPMYIAEIAPADRRGLLVSINQLMIVIGISASFFSNDFILTSGAGSWRWMLGVEAIPALVFLALLTTVPESPRWLLAHGRRREALAVLCAVRGGAAEQELQDISRAAPAKRAGSWSALLGARMRFVLVFAAGLAFFQQITGINAVLYYLPTIFAQAGGGLASAFRQAAIVGAVNFGMTLVAMRWIDRLGRKPLLIVGTAGMAAALLAISWAFRASGAAAAAPVTHPVIVLIAIVAFVACFAISLGPVTWVMVAEIFPNEQRALAISVVGFWNSLVSATVTLVFPWEIAHWGASGTFLGYGTLSVAALAFVLLLGPETRGKTLEEIERSFLGRRVWRTRQRAAAHESRSGDGPATTAGPAR
ncbi:MAG TPA: sugar porter family MFS transporter [Steroidobacteraceae bacterium]|nr:sugar porter family MFS transporter [Steroidobacteraceae bacterium]